MTTKTDAKPADPMAPCNKCRDHDEDCLNIEDKIGCWLYAPEQGWCPFLIDGAKP